MRRHNLDLERQRHLASREKLTPDEATELDAVNVRLDQLGFRFFFPDDEYSRYLRIRNQEIERIFKTKNVETLARRVVDMTLEEREDLLAVSYPHLSKMGKIRREIC